MALQEHQPGGKNIGAAIMAVTATYAYFLIFAQFGFLKAVQAATGGVERGVKPVMAVMAIAGMAGSALAAWAYAPARSRRLLAAGFVICAVAAGLSVVARAAAMFYVIALLVGLGTGLTTVTLASVLRRIVGGERLGTVIGLGTGLAYGFCNLPVVFEAGAATQAGLALLAAGAGLVGTSAFTFDTPSDKPGDYDYSGPGIATWVLIFLMLVALDSAVFYIIQHTPGLKEGAWDGTWRLEANAAVHLVAALLAGCALDRGWMGRAILIGAVALLVACLSIGAGRHALAGTGLLYAAGVSVYSTALVFYPARSLRPGLAALVYAVAGWGGSALGIGLAEGRHTLPGWYISVAGTVILLSLLTRHVMCRRWRAKGI